MIYLPDPISEMLGETLTANRESLTGVLAEGQGGGVASLRPERGGGGGKWLRRSYV